MKYVKLLDTFLFDLSLLLLDLFEPFNISDLSFALSDLSLGGRGGRFRQGRNCGGKLKKHFRFLKTVTKQNVTIDNSF